nr:hypothetical protein Iba_chr12aCG20550 [Ipomoea batatas]
MENRERKGRGTSSSSSSPFLSLIVLSRFTLLVTGKRKAHRRKRIKRGRPGRKRFNHHSNLTEHFRKLSLIVSIPKKLQKKSKNRLNEEEGRARLGNVSWCDHGGGVHRNRIHQHTRSERRLLRATPRPNKPPHRIVYPAL